MPVLRERGWENRIEIYIDGGIRRATDIIKALCLGATGVGIGRPFLYAMSAYGYVIYSSCCSLYCKTSLEGQLSTNISYDSSITREWKY